MKVESVDLKSMATRTSQYPEDNKPEFLLCGRSNVGKSSFIKGELISNPGLLLIYQID